MAISQFPAWVTSASADEPTTPPTDPPPTDPPPGPPLDQIYIQSISYAGTGCAPGTLTPELNDDRTAFTLRFHQFTAIVGPGLPLTDSRKNCQVNVLFHVPAGYTYAFSGVEQGGHLDLAAGARGMVKTHFYARGQAPSASVWTIFTGPATMDWQVRDEVEPIALVWAPCGVARSMNINTQAQVQRSNAVPVPTSFISVDRESLDQRYSLVWRQCPIQP